MNDKDLFKQVIFEYFLNALTRYERDVLYIKNYIDFHDFDDNELMSLRVARIRLDTARVEFRNIRQLIDVYLSDDT